ncbi:FecR family protein [Rufibacter hautae]|uniref:DUF4974 domain-containing protein n=1 Tax=Rufibacter hautae TaxID=2595005 RepID=A0A5B6TDF4_9BACT|nr:FecR domain-containing protein [Rufibacter hautae]KAA3438196.1 DUF4974 domain-containing protein [Rufibacter hautae]
MSNRISPHLIDKYLANNCTPEEKLEVERWYASFDMNGDILDSYSEEEQVSLENKLLAGIHQKVSDEGMKSLPFKPVTNPSPKSLWLKVAAVFLLLTASVLGIYQYSIKKDKVYETAYGERHIIMLPDGSKVVLNGKSSMRSAKEWSSDTEREVWLTGEAFFSVQHTKSHQKFLVHTSDGVTVEVLGTEFNVKKRQSGTQVVLREGSIRLQVESTSENKLQSLLLKPGDLIEVNTATRKISKQAVKPEKYTSWQAPQMVFENTPVSDIVAMLQETYGYEVVVQDEEILTTLVTGLVPNDNVQVLLAALGETLGVDIKQENKRLLFSKK